MEPESGTPETPPPTAEPAVEAPEPEVPARHAHRTAGRAIRDYFETVLVAVLIVIFATTFAVQNSVIPSASMEDTLLIGDYILVNKVMFAPEDASSPASWLAQREIRRDDVVVFKFPGDPQTDYIKRVIGLPGDRIEVRDKALVRNGRIVDEPWAVHRTGVVIPRGSREGPRDNFGPVVVPEGMLFMMGDNRDYSRDSREFGFVPRDHVLGRAFVVFWSKRSQPGAYRRRGVDPARLFVALRSLHRDVRWGRILTIVR